MGSIVLQQLPTTIPSSLNTRNNTPINLVDSSDQYQHQQQHDYFLHTLNNSQVLNPMASSLSTSSTAFDNCPVDYHDEAIVVDAHNNESHQQHGQLEEDVANSHHQTRCLSTPSGRSHEGSTTTETPSPTDKNRRKKNNLTSSTLSRILQQDDTEVENRLWKDSRKTIIQEEEGSPSSSLSIIHNQYNDNSELGMDEDSNIEENAPSLADQWQACEYQQNTTLRKTCNEEILLHNSNDSIIIRSYNYETDEKQVNKIFVEGIKSIVPTYLQTFYLFIHHFGILQVFSILSLFYISSFMFQFGIIKLLFNPDESTTEHTTSLLSILLSSTNLSASSTIYAIISTVITCTSLVVLMLCGLSKYVDYSARSYIYQQFKYSDMSNIQKFYIWDEDNHFWVAQLKSTGEIVGTIGVRKRPNQEDTVELKRMSVSSSMKRKGVASLMLNHLLKWSKEKGYKTITLSTSSLQAAAADFYKKNGFSVVKMRRYSRFLPTAHLTFEKHL